MVNPCPARVRRKGTPTQTASFTKLADANGGHRRLEGRVLEGRHFPKHEAHTTPLPRLLTAT